MPSHDITGGPASDARRGAAAPGSAGAAERTMLAQIEDRIPVVIASLRRRQADRNREARDQAALSMERP